MGFFHPHPLPRPSLQRRLKRHMAAPALAVVVGMGWLMSHRMGPTSRPAGSASWIESLESTGASHLSPVEGQRPDPVDFTPEELRELNRRFGVHGPQPAIAQLFTEGLDQLQPLRNHTLSRLEELRPLILRHSSRQRINPMLVAAVLFDEMQHAKPGEDSPLAVRSGLFDTQGPAQLSVGEMVKQGLLPENASHEQIQEARLQLLDPDHNVELLVGKFARLSKSLGFSRQRLLMASDQARDAKALATLAYLHNGKLDYPARILRYMQDPALHEIIYSQRKNLTSPLI
ncbi:MAG: helicase DnaB [Cyanobacteriota bacterium]|nr:helicase DnaB [Cyanobacteriota bacterium]